VDVSCPKCGKPLPVDHSQADESGLVRLQCFNCGKKLLLKVNRPDLKLSGDAGAIDSELSLTDLARKAETKRGGNRKGVTAFWAARVTAFPEESLSALRAVLTQIPRYARNPNKVFDLIGELPFVFAGLSFQEVSRLEACLHDCGATFRVGPEREVLSAPQETQKETETSSVPQGQAKEPESTAAAVLESEPVESEDPTEEAEEAEDTFTATASRDEVLLLAVEVGPQIESWMKILSQRMVLDTPPGTRPSIEEINSAEAAARDLLRDSAREIGADVVLGLRSSLFTLADGSSMLQLEGNAARRATPT